MTHRLLSFQPYVGDWGNVKREARLRDYILYNPDVKKGDLVYWFAGGYGFSGWGYVRNAGSESPNADGKMYLEVF